MESPLIESDARRPGPAFGKRVRRGQVWTKEIIKLTIHEGAARDATSTVMCSSVTMTGNHKMRSSDAHKATLNCFFCHLLTR